MQQKHEEQIKDTGKQGSEETGLSKACSAVIMFCLLVEQPYCCYGLLCVVHIKMNDGWLLFFGSLTG